MMPSIFNDVIGPVMRGPSSSHTAASHRIGTILRQLCNPENSRIIVEFDKGGSLATTYEGQGSSMGLICGLAGLSITDRSLIRFRELPAENKFEIVFRITSFEAPHPNTYKIRVEKINSDTFEILAVSTGGGMLEVTQLNGFDVSIKGDFYETLVCINSQSDFKIGELYRSLENIPESRAKIIKHGANNYLIKVQSRQSIKPAVEEIVNKTEGILWIRQIDPVLPVLSGSEQSLPFTTIKEMLKTIDKEGCNLAEMAIKYEIARAGFGRAKILSLMKEISGYIYNSILEGLKGQNYPDRILGHQAHLILQAEKEGKIIATPLNTIIAYVTAIMETKSSLEIIVAAPTAGSCGTLGGAIFGLAEHYSKEPEEIVNAFFAAGLVGVFIADKYTFAAEEGGCQVECGAASAMAAAGLAQLMGGNAKQALDASSMALQNCLGMICDPVAYRVEVPCLGKNILAATNALSSANMALAGFDPVIPLDEVIDAMKSVGDELPRSLCCTGLGGLSQTPSSLKLHEKLNRF